MSKSTCGHALLDLPPASSVRKTKRSDEDQDAGRKPPPGRSTFPAALHAPAVQASTVSYTHLTLPTILLV